MTALSSSSPFSFPVVPGCVCAVAGTYSAQLLSSLCCWLALTIQLHSIILLLLLFKRQLHGAKHHIITAQRAFTLLPFFSILNNFEFLAHHHLERTLWTGVLSFIERI